MIVDILLFIFATAVTAAFMHSKIKSLIAASVLTATLAALGLQVVVLIQLGYLQALALVGFVTSWLLALVVALVTGWLTRRLEKKSDLEHGP